MKQWFKVNIYFSRVCSSLKNQRSYWGYPQYRCHIFETRHTTDINLQPQNNIKPILHLLWLQISRFVLGLKIYQHYVFRWTIGVFKVGFFFLSVLSVYLSVCVCAGAMETICSSCRGLKRVEQIPWSWRDRRLWATKYGCQELNSSPL